MAKLRLEVVTAEREVYADDVDMVIAPGGEGELGILPRHAPLLTTLQPGVMRLKKDGGETIMAVSGGFLQVFRDRVLVLADTAERADYGNRNAPLRVARFLPQGGRSVEPDKGQETEYHTEAYTGESSR